MKTLSIKDVQGYLHPNNGWISCSPGCAQCNRREASMAKVKPPKLPKLPPGRIIKEGQSRKRIAPKTNITSYQSLVVAAPKSSKMLLHSPKNFSRMALPLMKATFKMKALGRAIASLILPIDTSIEGTKNFQLQIAKERELLLTLKIQKQLIKIQKEIRRAFCQSADQIIYEVGGWTSENEVVAHALSNHLVGCGHVVTVQKDHSMTDLYLCIELNYEGLKI